MNKNFLDENDPDELREIEASGEVPIPDGGYLTLTSKQAKKQTFKLKRWVVICTDLPGLLVYLRQQRDIPWYTNSQLKIGIDAGQSK